MNHFLRLAESGRPLILAHRGDSAHAPENTLAAAVCGHAAGADGWELDVRLTRDEVPVVIHDASLLRTTDVAARFAGDLRGAEGFLVADFDWEEIRGLDAGSWFIRPGGGPRSASAFGTLGKMSGADRERFASARVPSLAEALNLTVQLDWIVNVELKTFPEGRAAATVAKVVDLIRSMGMASRILISSFAPSDLCDFTAELPEIATGVLTVPPIRNPRAYVREIVGADFYHPSADALGAGSIDYRRRRDPALLGQSDLDPAALPTFVYTVNDPILADHLSRLGVAGLFSDDPAGLGRGRVSGDVAGA